MSRSAAWHKRALICWSILVVSGGPSFAQAASQPSPQLEAEEVVRRWNQAVRPPSCQQAYTEVVCSRFAPERASAQIAAQIVRGRRTTPALVEETPGRPGCATVRFALGRARPQLPVAGAHCRGEPAELRLTLRFVKSPAAPTR